VQTATGSELVVFQQNDSNSTSPFRRGDVVWLAWEPEHSLAIKEPEGLESSLGEEEEEGDVPAAEQRA